MAETIPVLRVFDYQQAVDFYVGRLGFKLDWERRPDEGPFQLQISMDQIILLLVQYPDKGSLGSWVLVRGFKHLVAYRKRIMEQADHMSLPPLKQVPGEPGTLSMAIIDPFFNRIEFREMMR